MLSSPPSAAEVGPALPKPLPPARADTSPPPILDQSLAAGWSGGAAGGTEGGGGTEGASCKAEAGAVEGTGARAQFGATRRGALGA